MDTETLEKLYDDVFKPLIQVEAIFNKWFGEEKIDFQRITKDRFIERWSNHMDVTPLGIKRYYADLSYPIIINFGTVTITNENNQSKELPGMLAKVIVATNGSLVGSFGLNRYIYTERHLLYGYMHSHVNRIPDDPSEFQSSCLGSGPIRSTISTLNMGFNADVWELFCVELQRYVETESLRGGPYHRLAQLGRETTQVLNFNYSIGDRLIAQHKNIIVEFMQYLYSHMNYSYNYIQGRYGLNMTYPEFVKDISKKFFTWYEGDQQALTLLERQGVIIKGMVVGDKIKTPSNSERYNYHNIVGERVCTFKGQPLVVQIVNEASADNVYYLLSVGICNFILSNILNFINTVPIFKLFNHPNVLKSYEEQGNTESIKNSKELFLL